ncbi:MAG TPA: thiamine pyrophosphate-requiring protein [Candidatus Dormibacteraeota bacterium]|nr:thiamine pyrophosphate-requiring protein [Candidatus Dormibacteraeota bacterium]
MSETTADLLIDRIAEWGVRTVYGFPGDGINGILAALRAKQDAVRFIQTRHEEQAAFMACAHAKFTGEVGVCMATSGPGAIHLLNGLYDAKLDHQPVVAIVGQTYASAMGGDQQQEVDLLSLYKDVASAYVQQVNTPAMLRHVVDRAFRIADAEHTVTAVIVPGDVQEMKGVPEEPQRMKSVHTSVGFARTRQTPDPAEIDHAADVLNAGCKVAMLVGAGAAGAVDEVIAVADKLSAGIAKALLGKAAIPDDIPYVTGTIGLLGTRPSWNLMRGCDTLLMVGTSFPYANFLPDIGAARGVQIDHSPRMLGLRYPMEVMLCGDSQATLTELLPKLARKDDRTWQAKIIDDVAHWWRLMKDRAEPRVTDGRLNPQPLFDALSKQLPDNAILTTDAGTAAQWFAQQVRVRRGMKASLSGNLATMLPGVPYAIAAKFAFPDRVAIALVGDGTMEMGGMNELLTAAKYYRNWSDPRLVVLVLNNGDLNMVTWEQRVMAGSPKFDASQEIPYVPFEQWAELIGLKGIKVDKPEEIENAWHEALSADRPVVINAITDPEEPPLPPHISFQQARSMSEAVLKGDPHGLRDVMTAVREKVDEFVPGR